MLLCWSAGPAALGAGAHPGLLNGRHGGPAPGCRCTKQDQQLDAAVNINRRLADCANPQLEWAQGGVQNGDSQVGGRTLAIVHRAAGVEPLGGISRGCLVALLAFCCHCRLRFVYGQ